MFKVERDYTVNKQILLLLSFCAVSPVMYGMESTAPQQADKKEETGLIGTVEKVAEAVVKGAEQIEQDIVGTAHHNTLENKDDGVPTLPVITPTAHHKLAPQPSRISSALNKAYVAYAALKTFAKNVLPKIKDTIWGKAPVLPDYSYETFKHALITQGEEVKKARTFQAKRAITLSTVATLIGSTIAHKLGANKETAVIGLGIGLATGIASWLYYGKVARTKELAHRHHEIVNRAKNGLFGTGLLEVSSTQAKDTYDEIYREKVGTRFINKACACARPDLREIRSIVKKVEAARTTAKH